MVKLLETVKDLPKFVERTIPLLTHFQVCEGLQKTLFDVVPYRVMNFGKTKLAELVDFNQNYLALEPNLSAFGSRIRLKSRALAAKAKGVVPFVFGQDYKPDMMHD